jgi:hypothetical protein
MRFEFIHKQFGGFKISLLWGREGQLSLYIGTNVHPWYKPKVYFYRSLK